MKCPQCDSWDVIVARGCFKGPDGRPQSQALCRHCGYWFVVEKESAPAAG